MKHFLKLLLLSLVIVLPFNQIHAKEDKELRQQRQAAQKERQAEKKQRNQEINDSIKSFSEFTASLRSEYPPLLEEIDIEFEFKQVELQADRNAKIAEAEAEYQTMWTSLLMPQGGQPPKEALKEIEEKAKALSDKLFQLKEEAAKAEHKEKIASKKRKHALLQERDTRALDEAAALGLTKKYEPITAKPIGSELTRQETQWNEREEKDIERIHQRHHKIIQEFRNGQKLREWELQNFDEDFQLQWKEKRELHELETQQQFFNSFLMQPAQGTEVKQQDVMAKFAEIAKQNKLVKIKYDTIRKKNSITRREEKKKLQNE
jgi:hypothetical protein